MAMLTPYLNWTMRLSQNLRHMRNTGYEPRRSSSCGSARLKASGPYTNGMGGVSLTWKQTSVGLGSDAFDRPGRRCPQVVSG